MASHASALLAPTAMPGACSSWFDEGIVHSKYKILYTTKAQVVVSVPVPLEANQKSAVIHLGQSYEGHCF